MLDRETSRIALIGLASVILLYVCFGLVHAYMLPIYKPGDERRHTQYVVVLEAEGRLPTPKETRAAHHPPLYYAVLAKTVMRGVDSIDGIDSKVRAGRIVSVAFAAIGLIYAFLIIRLLLPAHPGLAVHATAIMAVIPSYANNTAAIGNDSLAFASQFAMIYASLLILLRGPTWPRILQVVVVLSIVALTRVSGILVMPVALLAVAAGVWWHADGPPARRAGLAALVVAGLISSVILTSGWFYWRNLTASGDPTGQAAILEQVRHQPIRSPLAVLLDPSKWLEMHDETWGRLAGSVYIKGSLLYFARLLTVLSLAGAAISLWRAQVWRHFRHWRTPRVFSWVIVAGVFASVVLPMFVYHARGGGLHQRYVFGALYVGALVLALGFAWSARSVVPIAGYCATFVLCYSIVVTYAAILVKKAKVFPVEQAFKGGVKFPAPVTTLLLAGLILGLIGVIYALAKLHRPLVQAGFDDD